VWNLSKIIILNYCKTLKTHDIDHLQSAIENERYIENGEYEMMNGCPRTYGLNDHIGLCEIEDTDHYTEQQKTDMCNRCWNQVLRECKE
jgi:hypothetical protein